jgi:hypothetical protein
LDANYALTQTSFLQREAAVRQVRVLQNKLEAGTVTLNFLLDAQRRAADAQVAFYRSLSQYNMSIVEVHFRKGSLVEHCGVLLQEGPWPAKAYFDALIRARQRDASYYFDYGYTRPKVISRGPVSAQADPTLQGQQRTVQEEIVTDGESMSEDVYEADELPTPATLEPADPVDDSSGGQPRSALRFTHSKTLGADASLPPSEGPALTPATGGGHSSSVELRQTQRFEWDGIFQE